MSNAQCPTSRLVIGHSTLDICLSYGEGGIRTPDRGISPYNGLANRRLQPLGHLSTIARLNLAAGRTVRHPLLTGKTKPPRLRGLCPPERPRGLERNPERLVQPGAATHDRRRGG